MNLFDMSVLRKTGKVFVQVLAAMMVLIVFLLLITSFCQQRVYQNVGLDRNAYVEVFDYVVGKK